MDIGRLRDVVLFRVNLGATAGAGGQDNYTDLLTTRGRLTRSSGSRSAQFGDIEIGESWTLVVRKQAKLTANLSTSLKVVVEGQTYTMQGWEETGNRPYYYRIILSTERG